VVGVIAIRSLSSEDLGAYSVLFSAFLVGSLVPSEVHFLPRLVTAMQFSSDLRLIGIGRAIGTSLRSSAMGAAVVVVAAAAIWRNSDAALLVPEMLAAVGLVAVSPAQDHLRRCLHIGEQSGRAALVSAFQLTFVIGLAASAAFGGLPIAKLPLTLLLVANILSLLLGLMVAGRQVLSRQMPVDLTVRGRSVLVSSVSIMGSGLLGSILVSHLAGPSAVGYAEAARTAAQPILVVAVGLLAAISSRALGAIHDLDRLTAQRVNRLFVVLMMLTTFGLMMAFLFEGSRRSIAVLIPAAVEVPGLALVSIAANLLFGLSFLWRDQLINGGHEFILVKVDKWATLFPLVSALASPWLGAFARGVGLASQGFFRSFLFRRAWDGIFVTESTRT
jgi:hypothetical protein